MTPSASNAPAKPPVLQDGDRVWLGVDERIDPANLPAGYCSSAKNVRFRTGEITPRGGSVIMACGPTDGQTAFNNPKGGCVFKDPNGAEWFIVADEDGVYATAPNMVAQTIPLNGNTLPAEVEFTQCFNVLVMWRGHDSAPLVMESMGDGWRSVLQSNGVDGVAMSVPGTKVIPNAETAEFFQSRLLVPFRFNGRADLVAVGDIGDYTRYKWPQNAFRINQGDSHDIVRIRKFGNQAIVIFKGQNIYYVTSLVPDAAGDYTSAYMEELTSRHGLLARNSVVQVGGDLFYLSTEQGVTSVKMTEENNLKPGVEHLSAPMEKTMARVNWGSASNCQAATWDDYIYFALPLDEAWILGDDIVADQGLTYSGSPLTATITGLTVGQRYLATFGANEFKLTDGATVYYGGVPFTAQNTSVTVESSGETALTITVQPITHENVNTGIIVFDTVTKTWAGVDEADGIIAVKRWLKATWQGRERLFYLSNDGYIRLYEDGVHDDKMETGLTPYTDLTVFEMPDSGDTVQVNSGDLITVITTGGFNTATQWSANLLGTDAPSVAATSLWSWPIGGYGIDAPDNWSAPNTTPSQINYGVRFTATNGAVPTIAVTGDWALIDEHGTSEIKAQDIETTVITRAYVAEDFDHKRFQGLDLVLATWAPTLTVTCLMDGVNEEHVEIAAKTFDNTKYYPVADDWETDNDTSATATPADGGHGNAYREDYSVVIPDLGFYLGDTGVVFDLHQEIQERRRLDNHRGRSMRVKIANTTGRCVIRQVAVAAIPGERRAGVRV